jgi:uncharacterized peroxidase-related enzyme
MASTTITAPRIQPLAPEETDARTRGMLEAVQRKLGMTPNMMKTMARSPAVLEGYLALSGALGGGRLKPAIREQLALEVGQANGCEYCLSAHSLLGKMAGLSPERIVSARRGTDEDPASAAALTFARRVLDARGDVSDADLDAARAAGLGDAEIAEIVAHVAINVLTNFFNNVVRTTIDFPVVRRELA